MRKSSVSIVASSFCKQWSLLTSYLDRPSVSSRLRCPDPVAPQSVPPPEWCEKKQPPSQHLSVRLADAKYFAGSKPISVPAAPSDRFLRHSTATMIPIQLGLAYLRHLRTTSFADDCLDDVPHPCSHPHAG